MDIKDWLTLFAVALSFGSFVIATLSFRRSKRLDSENLIFKYKAEGYKALLEKLTSVMDKMIEAKKFLKNLELAEVESKQELIFKNAREVDNEVSLFVNDAIHHSLFFPQSIYDEVDQFSSFLYSDAEVGETLNEVVAHMETQYDLFIEKAEDLHVLMREDLHIERLNHSLSSRLK